ncbi:protein translocase subunit SecD [Trueperella sp. LYQ143]|uniref:protein translocase subunit SecD n=1 Tax=Trueperella sp. LYQ143 TaxID=3391059 RepID=UPI003982E42B
MRRLVVLIVLMIALGASLVVGTVTTHTSRFAPDLALDLEGGTQIILTPITTDGSEVTNQDIREAINVIRQRVDATGVAEAEITAQGGSNIIVSLPGHPSQETLDLVRTSAVLRMRAVLTLMDPHPLSAEAAVKQLGEKAAGVNPATVTPEQLDQLIRQLADTNGNGQIDKKPAQTPANASDMNWVTEESLYQAYKLDCTVPTARSTAELDVADQPFVGCNIDNNMKFILGPAELQGSNLTQATSAPDVNQQGVATGGWAVHLSFDDEGAKIFSDVTTRLSKLTQPQNSFAMVLDGRVISYARVSSTIAGGNAQITGSFTAEQAANLANQLKFGSLPLNFEVQSEEQISATLGSEQLNSGLIAGLVGLALIIVYMIWQYHALGVVAIGSILLSTGLSYLVLCLLSWQMGYRLSMAGVLGIIISIGVTADSFIVYFERIRDEIRDRRSIPSAIQHGWDRAKRTIIISDFVNLVASAVLYLLTVGSVRGFAFTLGITTVLDLVVVMMFTYPVMTFLAKTQYFGQGKRGSGMDAKALESTPIYRGRGYRLSSSGESREESSSRRSRRAKARVAAGADSENAANASAEKVDTAVRTASDSDELAERISAEETEHIDSQSDNETDEDIRPGESLAQRRARLRRAAKNARTEGADN